MKICLPTNNKLGLQSDLAANFSAANWLLVVESETQETRAIDMNDEEQRKQAVDLDVIVCHGLPGMLNDARIRLCVPLLFGDVDNPAGKDWRLAAHFGLAERFAVVDSLSGEILSECGISSYCPGPCHCPLPNLVDSGVDALAGQSMGFRLLQLSRRAKIPVLAVKAKTLVELSREMRGKSPALAMLAGRCLSAAPSRVAGAKK